MILRRVDESREHISECRFCRTRRAGLLWLVGGRLQHVCHACLDALAELRMVAL